MNKKNVCKGGLVSFFVVFILLAGVAVHAQEVKKIALLPFSVHAPSEPQVLHEKVFGSLVRELKKSSLIQVVSAGRVAGTETGEPVSEAKAMAVGKSLGVDYVLGGSISQFGNIISIDVRIYDIAQQTMIPGFSIQGRGTETLSTSVQQVKTAILAKINVVQRISRIEFRGNRKIGAGAIEQKIKSERGGVFFEETLAEDIRAIYKMGYFDDVQADVEDSPEGKVIAFLLQEKALVSEIVIKGNKEVSTSDIEGVLTIKVRQTLNTEKLREDLEKIRALYDSKGYYDAEVRDVVEKEGEKDVRVVIQIKENDRLYIRKISFEGNQAYTTKELTKLMSTKEKGLFHFFSDSGLLKKEQLKQDVNKITVFYLNNGFLNAQLGEPDVTHDKKGIYIKIPVVEGKQYRIGKVDIVGDALKVSKEDLQKGLKMREKEIFDRSAIIKDIDYLTQACNDEGYANAEVIPLTNAHEQEQLVDVTYRMTKNQLVYFNRINILGNDRTRDKVIRRQLSIVEGDLYSKTNLKKSYNDITRLRYFEEVDFQTQKGPDDSLTDVNIRVKEKPTGMFSVGAGYSAVDSAVFTAQISQQNLFGRGQSLALKASLGAKVTNFDLSFIEPWLFDMPLWSKFDAWDIVREYDEYDLDSKGAGVTLGYPLWGRFFGYVGYRFSKNDISDVAEDASTDLKEEEGKTTMSSLTLTLTRDTTDDNMFPSRGSKNTLSTEYTGGFLQGDAQFVKYMFTSTWFFPLPFETVFSMRGRIGYIQKTGTDDELPDYERFTLGGINSLRGLRRIGPRYEGTDDVKGGTTMLNFNFDYIFPLIKSAGMKGVIFFDTGNAWDDTYELGDMRKTAGIGIRWYSPIGPLRLEWGYVLDKKEDESPSRWEFTIGMFM
ncbi:MAG TPA: outer membrane protein assembly factor BamA [Syntrophales bacterium]|nr:outer membrane protein assembly factor BamA [Syntrophales bacterium]HPX55705.1 outer membrane protein assembly factor BamA [Syntrophales bacterium]HQA81843.1 outer membrane protein assembly factor BamA [Syntrophales bacterium]